LLPSPLAVTTSLGNLLQPDSCCMACNHLLQLGGHCRPACYLTLQCAAALIPMHTRCLLTGYTLLLCELMQPQPSQP
jgi:hypothetical protein